MTLLRICINFILISIMILSVNGKNLEDVSSEINYRLPDNVVPVHYNIKLIPYIQEDNFTFDGESDIVIEVRHVTRNLSLHAVDLTINETATLLISNETITYTPIIHNYDNKTEILTLYFNDELSPGIYNLNIQFNGILNNRLHGFFRSSYINENGEKQWLAVTHFEPSWARQAFPCWDEPALKATFNISIKHHRNYTALSNMPIRDQLNDEDDMIWTHFEKTPIMSTYLIAFIVADYVRIPNADETLNMWCRSALAPHSKFSQEIAQKSRNILTEYTNSTDKVPKIDNVAVPQLLAGAMENWGLIIYNERNFAYDEKKNTLDKKMLVAMTAAHEMAHQWFGNVVSPLWWSHVWLNEGFASFFEKYITDQIFKEWRVMDFFVVKTLQTALHMDIAKMMKPITFEVSNRKQINSLFSYSSYGKAPAILRMLQHIITPEIFQNGIINYLQKHQFSSATSEDLWNALQTILDKSNVSHNNYKLKEVMDTWLKQKHYPVVHVIRNYSTSEIIITQSHYQFDSKNKHVDNDKWWIPLTFATKTNPDFSNTLPTYWLKPQDNDTRINGVDLNDWIIVNIQQTGFYRVNYDELNWRYIANCLNSDNYTKIHVLNRAQIIDDAYHFVMGHQLDAEIFLDIMNYLSRETDYVALYPMFTILYFTKEFFKIPETNYYKQHILHILDKLIENVGYEENLTDDDITKLKRSEILKWACNYGHSECRKMATIKLNKFLTNPETDSIPINLKEWTYCNGIMEANVSTWNKLMDIYFTNPDNTILEYLTCSQNPDILINFINNSVSNNFFIKNNKYYDIITYIIQEHSNNDALLDYMLANLEQITPRKISAKIILRGIINSVYSYERLDKINNFFQNKLEEKLSKLISTWIELQKLELTKLLNKFFLFVQKESKFETGS